MKPAKASGTGSSAGCLVVIGVIFGLSSCGGLLIALPAFRNGLSVEALTAPGNIGSLAGGGIFTLAFLVVALFMIIAGGRVLLARARLTRPEVTLSTLTPRLGETVTLSYLQKFRAGTEVQGIHYQLILRESATYRRGTDSVTVRFDNLLQEYQVPGRHFNSGESLQEQRQFQLPALGMHTFSAQHNKLDWMIKVEVDMTGWPAYEDEYPLQVSADRTR